MGKGILEGGLFGGDSKPKRARTPKKKRGRTKWYVHAGVSRSDKKLHQHPSHPYPHARGRRHKFPPTSRIKDRKGKEFRRTPQELQRTRVKGTYRPRQDGTKRWD